MATRRRFLAGMLAAGIVPSPSWADVGEPRYLAGAMLSDGTHRLFGLSDRGGVVFSVRLPGRGHAAAAHPVKPEAVAFARRPGTFAVVIDCSTGLVKGTLESPRNRHFYGHGAYAADGSLLFTSENNYEAGRGCIGVWDSRSGYLRIDEFDSGGVGPHEIGVLPGGAGLIVANGGIETHPSSGRAALNLAEMRPNMAQLTLSGHQVGQIELDHGLRRNSIRHLAVDGRGSVAFAMQWSGDGSRHPPLLGLRRADGSVSLLKAKPEPHRVLENYAGSVAFSSDSQLVAITSPRGGAIHLFNSETGTFAGEILAKDVCGVSPGAPGLIATTGTGEFVLIENCKKVEVFKHQVTWDNHLISI